MSFSDPSSDSNARPRACILIVDDDPSVRDFVSELMESQGHEIVTAIDGIEGLLRLTEHTPDLVISDLNMPRMTGFAFLAAVRHRHPSIPVIALSGDFSGTEIPPGIHADAFLPKGSYQPSQLMALTTQLPSDPPKRVQSQSYRKATRIKSKSAETPKE